MATRVEGLLLEREFERLYRLHRREIYRSVLRDVRNHDEAEDVTQAAFLDAYRALRRGDEPRRPRAWLLAIAQNAARRRYRARAAGPREVELEAELLVAPDESGPSAVEIRQAFARLGARQRQALALREIAGRSYAEIAVALDLSVPAVETLLFRARRAFRQELSGWESPTRPRRRLLGGLLLWPPAPPGDAAGPLAGWAAKHGAAAKVAGALSAAALGTGVVLESRVATPADAPEQRPAGHELAPALADGRAAPALQAPVSAGAVPPRSQLKATSRAAPPAPPRGPGSQPHAVPPPVAVPIPLPAVAVPAAGESASAPLPVPDPPAVPALPEAVPDVLP